MAFVACWLLAAPARAELVFFSSGQSLSVKGHRDDGARMVLILKSGGEIVCDSSIIVRVAPDEVPDPDPASTPPADDALSALESFYAEIIDRVSTVHRVSPQLVRAVIRTESAYRTDAVSRKGAMGLMQLMPETARRYAVVDPFDPEANIGAGVQHLRGLLDRFDVALAMAAYNAGEAAVERFHGIPPYRETQDYVRRVLALAGVAPSQ
jgi:soluble lytic murein transglycosylase-like protein